MSDAVPAVSGHPPARSFQPRRRKLGPTRLAAYERLRRRFGIEVTGPPLEPEAGTVLDIGFGYGAALIELARVRPGEPVIGVEVHTPGVANVLEAIEAAGWDHVRVAEADVLDLLPRLPPASLAGIRIWFPDPWPKLRQQRRRLVRPEVVAVLVDRLVPGGFLHVATDSADYAAQVQRVCAAHPELRGGIIARPAWRPVTAYERRGLAAGRQPLDLWYDRNPA